MCWPRKVARPGSMVPSRLLIADVAVVRLLDDDRQQPSACPAASCRSCQEKQLLPLSRHQLQRGSCSHTQLTRPHHTLHCPNTIHHSHLQDPIFRLVRSLINISICYTCLLHYLHNTYHIISNYSHWWPSSFLRQQLSNCRMGHGIRGTDINFFFMFFHMYPKDIYAIYPERNVFRYLLSKYFLHDI